MPRESIPAQEPVVPHTSLAESHSTVPSGPIVQEVRGRLSDTLEIEFDGKPANAEKQKQVADSIDTIDRLLREELLSGTEIVSIQASMKNLETYENAVEVFGVEGVKRYFRLLSGPDADHPYFFAAPLFDDDLESYWLFDACHDDPTTQDQCVLDYLDDSVEVVAVNLLISRMKQNPDFAIILERDPGFQRNDLRFQKAGHPPLLKYLHQVIRRAEQVHAQHRRHPELPVPEGHFTIPLGKAMAAFDALFNKERSKKVHQYENSLKKGDVRFAAKVRQQICAKDLERFVQIAEIVED